MFPKLIEIGDFFIGTYGAMIALGVIVALFLTSRLAKSDGMNDDTVDHMINLAVYTVFGGIFASKLLLVLLDADYYLGHPANLISVVRAGGVFYGGLIGGTITAVYFLKKYSLPFFRIGDLLAPHIALAQMFGRFGCFSAGCCYGKECHHSIAVTFHDSFAHSVTGVPLDIPLYPIQLMNALNVFLIYLFLRFYAYKRRKFDGQILLLYFIIYSITRGLLEFFRGDKDRGIFMDMISTSQLISVGVFIVAVGFYFYRRKQAHHEKTV